MSAAGILMSQQPEQPSANYPSQDKSKVWDYIIVGGGPAGFVLAEQLSRNSNTIVILLEAGPDASWIESIFIPGFAGNNEFSQFVWDYYTVPQKQLNGAFPHLAQGKLFGGGTGVNYMNYNRGAKSVFNECLSSTNGLRDPETTV